MPNFDTSKLLVMAQQISQAAGAGDWERVQQLDGLLQSWLQQVEVHVLNDAQRTAWQKVAHSHYQAWQMCQQARDDANEQLRKLRNSQDAQKAYAWQEILG